jgi:hypothetical protein
MLGVIAEYVPEYPKTLIWKQDFEALDNQHLVSLEQYRHLHSIAVTGRVRVIVTDGCLLHGIHYNKWNETNYCDVEKTEKFILSKFNDPIFDNRIYLMHRGDNNYEQAGRQQTYEQALDADRSLFEILTKNKIKFINLPYVKDMTDQCKNIANGIEGELSDLLKY